jgi:acetyl esterase/lipase
VSRRSKYPVHPDFEKLPVYNMRFNRVVVGLLNLLIRLTRRLHRARAGVSLEKAALTRPDGTALDLLVFRPIAGGGGTRPALLYCHGGAFALTYGGVHLDNAAAYARECGCITVFVDYRLGPGYPFPHGFNDCYAALAWSVDRAGELGIDRRCIAVAGDSAGGALATTVAQKARDTGLVALCGQMLIYPVIDNECRTASAVEFVDTPMWTGVSNRRMWDMYLRDYPGELPPYAVPGRGNAGGLPTTYIETAEFDPLRDEAMDFAAALRRRGNEPVVNATQGTVHGYDALPRSAVVQHSVRQRIAFLNGVFAAARAATRP